MCAAGGCHFGKKKNKWVLFAEVPSLTQSHYFSLCKTTHDLKCSVAGLRQRAGPQPGRAAPPPLAAADRALRRSELRGRAQAGCGQLRGRRPRGRRSCSPPHLEGSGFWLRWERAEGRGEQKGPPRRLSEGLGWNLGGHLCTEPRSSRWRSGARVLRACTGSRKAFANRGGSRRGH